MLFLVPGFTRKGFKTCTMDTCLNAETIFQYMPHGMCACSAAVQFFPCRMTSIWNTCWFLMISVCSILGDFEDWAACAKVSARHNLCCFVCTAKWQLSVRVRALTQSECFYACIWNAHIWKNMCALLVLCNCLFKRQYCRVPSFACFIFCCILSSLHFSWSSSFVVRMSSFAEKWLSQSKIMSGKSTKAQKFHCS